MPPPPPPSPSPLPAVAPPPHRAWRLTRASPRLALQAPPPAMDGVEFEQLPLSVRKKCFSSLERLRIADSSHRQGLLLRHASSPAAPRSRSSPPCCRRRKSSASAQPCLVDPRSLSADSYFLSKLPEKALRVYFSKEERLLLGRPQPETILDAADVALQKLQSRPQSRRQQHPVLSPLHSELTLSRSSTDSLQQDPPPMAAPTTIMDRWKAQESALEEYRHGVVEQVEPSLPVQQKPRSRRSSFRKVLGLKTEDIDATPPLPTPPSAGRTSWVHSDRATRSSTSSFTHPASQYYQDPEARMKLKLYLASPQKFAEALEFGFPSNNPPMAEKHAPRLPRPSFVAARPSFAIGRANGDAQTFLRDDSLSFLDDAHSESESDDYAVNDDRFSLSSSTSTSADANDPITPNANESVFQHSSSLPPYPRASPPRHRRGSSSLSKSRSQYPRRTSSRNVSTSTSTSNVFNPSTNREMTLRMTLTKPELRGSDDLIYGWRKDYHSHSRSTSRFAGFAAPTASNTPNVHDDDDPLALEPLALDDNITPFMKQPPIPASAATDGKKKSLWRRMKRT